MSAMFYIKERIGPKRSITPEGFLLCEAVPIARIGMQLYGPTETAIKPAPGTDFVKIHRFEEDVFRPETIASVNGKSVVDDHPEDDVTPITWREVSIGVAMNCRRGTGAQDDLLLADLMITTEEGIKAIMQDGKEEISCGYAADYEETGPGEGKQTNIIMNHVALVDQGRCGPRCAIGDRKSTGDTKMGKLLDSLMKAFKAKDAAEVERIAEEAAKDMKDNEGEATTHIHIHSGEVGSGPISGDEGGGGSAAGGTSGGGSEGRVRFGDAEIEQHIQKNDAEHQEFRDAISGLQEEIKKMKGEGGEEEEPGLVDALRDEAPSEEEKEEAARAKDSAYLGHSYQDTIALAEILAPGIRVPTYDRAAKPGKTFKDICMLRRTALDLAYAQPATRGILDDLLGGRVLDTKTMKCNDVRNLFRSAAALRRAQNNNSRGNAAAGRTGDASGKAAATGVPKTLAEINRRNREHWAGKQ